MPDLTKGPEIQRMRFHGPGWTLDLADVHFKVWAPQPAEEYPACAGMIESSKPPRDHWAASWNESPEDEDALGDGDFRRGASLDEVLATFPADVARLFREVVNAA